MSECVVRMEMPYSCTECRFNVDGWCYAISEYDKQPSEVHYLTRPEWCPIICSLPEGHGRLVDAEMVKEKLKPVDSISHHEPEWTLGELHESNCVAIDNAPNIVPAEAERSET